MDKVLIKDLVARGIIGLNDWEREKPQEILINIVLFVDLRKAGESDQIEDSVNYRTIAKEALAYAESAKRYTVEALAADIMKIAMIQVAEALAELRLQAKLLLQVHDELVLECPEAEVVETAKLVQGIMENAYQLQVPLRTDAKQGRDWGSLQPIL